MNPKFQDPKYKSTIRLVALVSNTPHNQVLMGALIEQSEHVLQKAEGYAVIKCASEELQFMGNPNGTPLPTENPTKGAGNEQSNV